MTVCAVTSNPPVTFDPTAFRTKFPAFANCSDGQLSGYFDTATLFCANDTTNPAFCAGVLPQLLNLATAHVAWLFSPRDAAGNPTTPGAPGSQPPSALVGRIGNATEGSVSVGVEWSGTGSPSEAWFVQTEYGATFWQASAQFRIFNYRANPTIVPGTLPPGLSFYGRRPIGGRFR